MYNESFINTLIQECKNSKIEPTFPKTLPLLEEFRRIKIINKAFLKDVSILFIQHHLSPFIGRLNVMREDGMNPDRTWFIDIPYSTNKEVLEEIHSHYTEYDYPESYDDPLLNYTNFQLDRVKYVIKNILEKDLAKLLIIDDGAYFIRAVLDLYSKDELDLSKLYNRTFIVEQTTRGQRYLKENKYSSIIKILNSPIVSIARSNTKVDIESPFIGAACSRSITENIKIRTLINKRKDDSNNPLKIGIIGYGAVGSAVFESVKDLVKPHSNIDVVEINLDKWAEIRYNGGNPIIKLAQSKYDILFGCTGYKAFGWNDRNKIKKDGLLVSVSSASVEFSRSNYIEYALLDPYDPIEVYLEIPDEKIHAVVVFEHKSENHKFYFINSGFPVNFTGKRECLPLKFIQPTHALLYAASYQVLNQPIPGFNELNREYDYWIYYNAFNYV